MIKLQILISWETFQVKSAQSLKEKEYLSRFSILFLINHVVTLWKGYLITVQHFKIQREGIVYCASENCGIFILSPKWGIELVPITLWQRLQHSRNPNFEPEWWSKDIRRPFSCMRGITFANYSPALSMLHRPSVSPGQLVWFKTDSVKPERSVAVNILAHSKN